MPTMHMLKIEIVFGNTTNTSAQDCQYFPSLRLTLEIQTAGVLKFSIIAFSKIDTPGFGDVVDNTNCWQPITGEQSQVGNQSQVNLRRFTF